MESSTNRRWVITGVLGLALIGAGCGAGTEPQTQGGPAVVMDATPSGKKSAPPTDSAGPSTTNTDGQGAGTSSRKPKAPSAKSPDTAKKVPLANPRSVNDSSDSPPSADTP